MFYYVLLLTHAFAVCIGAFYASISSWKPMKAPCLGPLGTQIGVCPKTQLFLHNSGRPLQTHRLLDLPVRLRTMAPDLQAILAPSQQTTKSRFFTTSTKFIARDHENDVYFKNAHTHTHTHTHPPADGNLAASTTPIASLSGNTLLFSQWKITPKRVHNQKQISHMQARDRDASHPKSDSARMLNVAHGGRSSCPCSHIGMNHVLVCVRSLAVIWLLFAPVVWIEP